MLLKLHKRNFSSILNQKFLQEFSPFLIQLYEFKIILRKLIQEKKFHYLVLNQSVGEIDNVEKITQKHQEILKGMIKKNNLNFTDNRSICLDEKFKLVNSSSVPMSYKAFLELMKYMHESKEDGINNLIREIVEKNYKDSQVSRDLVLLRDEWREAFDPEVLDENSKPVYELCVIDKVCLEVNKKLFDVLI
jgi:hypothetical protein